METECAIGLNKMFGGNQLSFELQKKTAQCWSTQIRRKKG